MQRIAWTVVALFILSIALTGQPRATIAPELHVTGSLIANRGDAGPAIALAGMKVTLRSRDRVVSETTTDAYGHYIFRNPPPGTYRLCWPLEGWRSDCAEREIVVRDESVAVLSTVLQPAGRFLAGRVTFRDGSPAYQRSKAFDVEVATRVEGRTSRGVVASTQANVAGDYILTALPDDEIEVTAAIGRLRATERTRAGSRGDLRLEVDRPREPQRPPPGARRTIAPRSRIVLELPARRGRTEWTVSGGRILDLPDGHVEWEVPENAGVAQAHILTFDANDLLIETIVDVVVGDLDQLLKPAPGSLGCSAVTYFHDCPPGTPNGCDDEYGALSRKSNDLDTAKDYYAKVDPQTRRLTLDDWLKVAGYKLNHRATRGFYTNNNDLGFGRDMRIFETPFGVFGYVVNFAEECKLQHPGNAKLAQLAPPERRIATVCMEWSSPTYHGPNSPGTANAPKDRIVKFFVYGGDGKRLNEAALDENGFRPIPNLCVNCHGGQSYSKGGSINLNARFLPFDLDSFKFDGKPDYNGFEQLNKLVRKTEALRKNSEIRAMINTWYPSFSDSVPNLYIPKSWQANAGTKKIYERVVARSCRTCHIAFNSPTWSTWEEFRNEKASIGFAVAYDMPHAYITKMNMYSKVKAHWPDESGPKVLQCFLDHDDDAAMQACLAGIP